MLNIEQKDFFTRMVGGKMTSDIKKKDHPKSIEPLYDKKLTCLYCEKNFTSKQVRTTGLNF